MRVAREKNLMVDTFDSLNEKMVEEMVRKKGLGYLGDDCPVKSP